MKAAAYVVGPREGAGASLQDLARELGFAPVERYGGLVRAEKQAAITPLLFFFYAAVEDVVTLKPSADAIRHSSDVNVRFSPLIYFVRQPSLDCTRQCIKLGFDDVIALPYGAGDLAERIKRQVGQLQTYYETATYFGPDRRNRTGHTRPEGSDHGGGEFRRIEIVRSDAGVDIVRDDFQVEV